MYACSFAIGTMLKHETSPNYFKVTFGETLCRRYGSNPAEWLAAW